MNNFKREPIISHDHDSYNFDVRIILRKKMNFELPEGVDLEIMKKEVLAKCFAEQKGEDIERIELIGMEKDPASFKLKLVK